MKFKSLYFMLFLSLLHDVHFVIADQVQSEEQADQCEQLQQDLEDEFTKAVETKNKAQILGYIKQDPSLIFSFAEYEEFLDNPNKTIRMFTTMKKAGVNLNYQDEDGESILHLIVEIIVDDAFTWLLEDLFFNNIGNAIYEFFFDKQGEDDEQDEESSFLSESAVVLKIKNAQKIVKALCKLGVKKNLKTCDEDQLTAAEKLELYIDEFEDEFTDHPVMKELQKLYKMLK